LQKFKSINLELILALDVVTYWLVFLSGEHEIWVLYSEALGDDYGVADDCEELELCYSDFWDEVWYTRGKPDCIRNCIPPSLSN
jgi:hypothetical protein